MKKFTNGLLVAAAVVAAMACSVQRQTASAQSLFNLTPDTISYVDPNKEYFVIGGDTVRLHFADRTDRAHAMTLSERDIEEFAAELGVEVAAIKAVIDIEAGKTHQGFWKEGKPIINFDLTVFRQMARRHGVNVSKYASKYGVVFARPNIAKYGSQQAAVQARLDGAMAIDSVSAIEGTFWGMFQIGGFNWRQCGMSSAQEFYRLMSRSERDQLELFGEFITRSGLLPSLKAKNWSAFARGYNGPSYAARGYHTRLARAYQRHKSK